MKTDKLSRLKSYLSLQYDIDIQDITPVKNVIRITTDRGDKCLKRIKYGKGHFLFILSAMRHLQDGGFDGIIPFIPTKSGEMYIELEDGFGFLTDWIKSRECSYSNPIELRKASTTLACIHKASENFIPLKGAEPRMEWGKWPENFSKRIKELGLFKGIIESKDALTDFDKLYLENLDYYYNQGIRALDHLKGTKYNELSLRERERNSFCHHDYAHHNVLICEDFKIYVIDFDYCICDTRLHDLASLIIRNMRHGNWNMEKAQYIIDCYMEAGEVDKDEISVINAFMEFPQDFWQVGLQYYVEKQKWEEENFNRRLNNVIKDRADRQEFLEEFKYSIEV